VIDRELLLLLVGLGWEEAKRQWSVALASLELTASHVPTQSLPTLKYMSLLLQSPVKIHHEK
jgi:hypothetical protein